MTSSPQGSARGSHASIWLSALLVLGVAVSGLLAGAARPANPASGLIAFSRSDGVYVMRPDGSGGRLLWRGGMAATDLSWAPDGSRLAISTWGRSPAGWPGTDASVLVVNADGSNPVRIASVGASSLSWSPDGRKIAFTAKRGTEDPDIWVTNPDGSNMHRLKRTPKLWDGSVDWKPTGGWLAFDSGSWVPFVHVVRTNGSGLHRVLPQLEGAQPDWSPDGRRFAYMRPVAFPEMPNAIGPGNGEIWVMNASGTSQVRLTKNRLYDGSPAWSPDGQRIVFVREHSKTPSASEIWVMNADGMSEKRLTAGASPAWQPPLAAP